MAAAEVQGIAVHKIIKRLASKPFNKQAYKVLLLRRIFRDLIRL